MTIEIKHTGIVDREVDQTGGSHRTLTRKHQGAFLNGESAQCGRGRSHHVARARQQEGAETGLGEVGGAVSAREGGAARLAAADKDQGFTQSSSRAVVEGDVGTDHRRCCSAVVKDQAAVHDLEQGVAARIRSDVAVRAQRQHADGAVGHRLDGGDVRQRRCGRGAQHSHGRGVVQHEAVCGIVTQEVEILAGTAATHDGRQRQHAARIAGSRRGDEELLVRAEVGGEIRTGDRHHAGVAARQRTRQRQGRRGRGTLGQLKARCATVGKRGNRKCLVRRAKRQRGAGGQRRSRGSTEGDGAASGGEGQA